MIYIEIDEGVKEVAFRNNAAITIQSVWRGVLTRRKSKVMLKGFTELQKLFREKLQVWVCYLLLLEAIFILSFYIIM